MLNKPSKNPQKPTIKPIKNHSTAILVVTDGFTSFF
jgi:hypothetical protein